MKQIGTKQFNSNDVMSLHRDMTAVKTPNETKTFHRTERTTASVTRSLRVRYISVTSPVVVRWSRVTNGHLQEVDWTNQRCNRRVPNANGGETHRYRRDRTINGQGPDIPEIYRTEKKRMKRTPNGHEWRTIGHY